MLRKWGMMVLMLLAAPALVFAQNTGKIAGVITDADTGDPLPGASIILVGTSLGTITDVDGNYFILGVPVAEYEVRASFVGYQTLIQIEVDVSSGYTQEINFALVPGVELDEIVIEYERPLIQKDAIGVPKIVSSEQIVTLPVRGSAAIAKTVAGVVAKEGSSTLNIRGSRGSEVQYFIDGVKVFGSNLIPQSAVQEQEMLIGSISARYGDAMSGIINITTKSGSSKFFGSFEGITSSGLDDFDYNLASFALGGPITGSLGFFLSAEFIDRGDRRPSAFGQIFLSDEVLSDLDAFPIAFEMINPETGEIQLAPVPNSLGNGAAMLVDDNGLPVIGENGAGESILSFDDGTQVVVPTGFEVNNLRTITRADEIPSEDFQIRDDKRHYGSETISVAGNLTMNVLENGRLRLGGRYVDGEFENTPSLRLVPFATDYLGQSDTEDYQIYGTWTHYLSNSSFYQLQVDFSSRETQNFDPRFGTDFDDFLNYSDIDGSSFSDAASVAGTEAFATLRGYKNLRMVTEERDDGDGGTITVSVPTYVNTYQDGQAPGTEVVSTLVAVPGGRLNGFSRSDNTQFRFTASATTQIGIHQLEFGGEYETRTFRSWSIGSGLSRYVNDASGPEAIEAGSQDLNPEGYTSYSEIPIWLLEGFTSNVGVNASGTSDVDSENLDLFVSKEDEKNAPESKWDIAPYEPIYYGAYVQDKIEFRDIVLNLGLRFDVFDNNTRVLKDQFARRPIERANLISDRPANIEGDFAVYYSGDTVIGYRDLVGTFFDASGGVIQQAEILLNGKVRQTNPIITQEMFEDYDPELTVMPRIGVSFPITDQALFFASYGVVSQRPSTRNFTTLASFQNTGGINNTGLVPEKTTKYEVGFRQRVGARAALSVSGFFRQIENLIQIREIGGASPSVYRSSQNVDFGTVKGMEFDLDLRRTSNIAVNLNYTLSFADGTGSSATTTGTIVWIDETPPNFISPLSFDQRHKINLSLDLRYGQGEGPKLGDTAFLQHFGFNVFFTAGSAFPFTGVTEPFNLAGAARAANPRGAINGDRMTGQSRVDIRFDRAFRVGNSSRISVFLWVQNLFDQENVNDVWRFSGLPDDDGFLSTSGGAQFISSSPVSAEALYQNRNRVLANVGIPRLTRLGLRFDF